MELFSYKGECGIHEHTCTCIKAFKEELAWGIDKWLRFIISTMLFNTVMPLRI